MNRTIIRPEVETVIKKLPTNKSPGPNSSTGKFYQTFREELVSIFLKLLKKIAEEGNLPNWFYEAIITLVWRPDKETRKKWKLQANITDRCKKPQQITSNPNPTLYLKYQEDFIPVMHRFFNSCKSVSVTHYINKLKIKNIWSSQNMQKKLLA